MNQVITPARERHALPEGPDTGGTGYDSLPARPLDRRELRALVEELAADPSRWEGDVDFPAEGGRHYASLHRDSHVDVWLLCWRPGDDTGWHDHDISSGAVRVVAGALRESNPRIGGEHVETLVTAGQSFSFGPDHIHRLSGAAEGSVSIHAYSPPLWRLGQYSIDEGGVMRRVSVSYADELRPVDPAEDLPEELPDAPVGEAALA
ncbi:cysteine dioxygenase family protein [Streptosporangium sandarakinum]|uniref:Putative metal-dependent enzyme (Double-stranded beta helix superfamily) n=1 Tax=Streptosporangium sandarakinum TaxID=1260955 RepID=A0A852V2K6_9ACTN|nr:cysteine dioxygenase family protein [Streptosporangium sandarakinum]NYF42256.1 putative metal-dependent enzyme (double-stranded beta helix superfamily) [Streptosporangium sandarakinum]